MKTFKQFMSESQYIYHGTTKKFDTLTPDRNQYMIDRALGSHFSSDKDIARKFQKGVHSGESDTGRIIKTKRPSRSKIEKVPQKTYYKIDGKPVKQSDQNAIADHVAHTVFSHPEGKDLFKDYVRYITLGLVDDDTIEKLHSHLSRGKSVHDHETFGHAASKSNTFRSYVSSKGGLNQFHDRNPELVSKFLNIQKKKGIKGLSYTNTSPKEMEGVKGSKCYVLFHPHEHEHPYTEE